MQRFTGKRIAILVLGPVLLVALSYWISIEHPRHLKAASNSHLIPRHAKLHQTSAIDELTTRCNQTALEWGAQLDDRFSVFVRTPYILIGDVAPRVLETHYHETILSTQRALQVSYFDRPPNAPISIFLLSDETTYRELATELDGQSRANYHGYYVRDDRRILLNLETGNGTLAHELTHALAHFDFPDMPEWFDEGLASLHEECDFSSDGRELIGHANWRSQPLLQAIEQDDLLPLRSLITASHIRPEKATVDYAHARNFCLFLQRKKLLRPFYRKLRTRSVDGAEQILRELFDRTPIAQIDREFRTWFRQIARKQG